MVGILSSLKDPLKEIKLVRNGLKTKDVEDFLSEEHLPIKDALERLDISSSTYFSKKKSRKPLDAHTTEKFIRLISVMISAREVMGLEAKNWLYKKVPSLGNQVPFNLLDTEAGHRLVEQALLQIKHGVYG